MTVLPSHKILEELGAIARDIGWRAADILHSYYYGAASELAIKHKKDGPVTAADLAANDYILKQLRIALGSQKFSYLSEENYQSPGQGISPSPLPHPWVWIVDPIDGTRAFIERTDEYAIHIALVYEGRPVVAVVVVPPTGKLYYARAGGGTFVETCDGDRTQLQVSSRDRLEDLCILTKRTYQKERLHELVQQFPCKTKQYFGSIGCKIAAIAEQEADVYISLSGKSAPKDWDFAAPDLIITEAGGKLTHLDGSPLLYNQGDISQWGCLIASNGQCHAELCDRAAKILAQLDK